MCCLIPLQYKYIVKLLTRENPPKITIIHGVQDTTLPVEMGRELAALNAENIRYYEISDGNHSSILTTHRDLIFKTLLGIEHKLGENLRPTLANVLLDLIYPWHPPGNKLSTGKDL